MDFPDFVKCELFLVDNKEIPQEKKQKIHNFALDCFLEKITLNEVDKDCVDTVKRLLQWKPLTPLTGDEGEWYWCQMFEDEEEPDENTVYQNRRCCKVFKIGKNGRAFYTEDKIFLHKGGKKYSHNTLSASYIDFPYEVPDEPKKIIVKFFDEKTGEEIEIEEVRHK